jgi:hypothetical protein
LLFSEKRKGNERKGADAVEERGVHRVRVDRIISGVGIGWFSADLAVKYTHSFGLGILLASPVNNSV